LKSEKEENLLILEGEVQNKKLSILIDLRASENFIKKSFIQKAGVIIKPNKVIKIVYMVNNSSERINSTIYNLSYKISNYSV
jgi:hypothetical protein